jgi:hypothetical protein
MSAHAAQDYARKAPDIARELTRRLRPQLRERLLGRDAHAPALRSRNGRRV